MIEFDYRLVGTGWSEARVADAHRHAVSTASYLSDALGNTIEAVAPVVEGAGEPRCSWDEEPGEYRWILKGVDDGLDAGGNDTTRAVAEGRGRFAAAEAGSHLSLWSRSGSDSWLIQPRRPRSPAV